MHCSLNYWYLTLKSECWEIISLSLWWEVPASYIVADKSLDFLWIAGAVSRWYQRCCPSVNTYWAILSKFLENKIEISHPDIWSGVIRAVMVFYLTGNRCSSGLICNFWKENTNQGKFMIQGPKFLLTAAADMIIYICGRDHHLYQLRRSLELTIERHSKHCRFLAPFSCLFISKFGEFLFNL